LRLSVESLAVSYGRTRALFDVSVDVETERLCCVIGRNGAGKTTMLNAVMGILSVDHGRVLIDGDDVTRLTPWRRVKAGLAYVPQERSGFPALTVEENLRVVLEAGSAPPAALDEVLDLFPALVALLKRPAGFLSGGQQQQLAIARALLTRPRMLLLDEPTEGIQPSIVAEIEDAIVQLHARDGVGVLIAEQYVELAMRLAEDYVVLETGRVAAAGSTASLESGEAQRLLAI
jgi:urea transport system ATP-binding protein